MTETIYIPKKLFVTGCLQAIGRLFEVRRLDDKIDYQKIKVGTGLTIKRIQEIEKGEHVGDKINFSEILKLYEFFNEKLVIIDRDFWIEDPEGR